MSYFRDTCKWFITFSIQLAVACVYGKTRERGLGTKEPNEFNLSKLGEMSKKLGNPQHGYFASICAYSINWLWLNYCATTNIMKFN